MTEGQGVAEEVPPGYKRTEVGVVPEEWEIEILSKIADVKTGPFGSSLHQRDYVEDGTPIITVEHLSERGVVHDNLPLVSDSDWLRLRSYTLRQGDIVFSRVGSVDRNSLVSEAEDGWLFSGRLLRVRVSDHTTHPPYLSYHFHSEPFKQRIHSFAVGQTMASLNTQILKEMHTVLPPLSEQRAIATALSDADGLIGALDALIEKKWAIKQAAMQQLLTGKKRLSGFEGEWGVKQFSEIADIDPENLSNSTDPAYSFNYVSLEQVDAGRLIGYSEEVFGTAPSRARRVLRYGDVLMSTVRPNLMAHLHYREQIKNAICSTGFSVLRVKHGLADSGFLFSHLFGSLVNKQIEKMLSGSNYPAISSQDVKLIEITCPPTIDEQRAIAGVLSDMDAEITALERRRDKANQIKQAMMQELLTGRTRLIDPPEAPRHDPTLCRP
ncbi:MAG: restriction endonuclease subunit S [Methanomicrobiales archaeon]|nr:restriction endonuclease subunit S [Methanomicrobiales archaeon]